MKVAAPGKLLLSGQYAVLEGGPALVMAVERHAVADGEVQDLTPTREVRAAFPDDAPPHVDVRALYEGDRKLGLGSSAAALVAAMGVRAARRGEDLSAPKVRARLLAEAFAVHSAAQGGGSGVDIAASIYGGTLHYERFAKPSARPILLPWGLTIVALWSGTPARTSELLARVAHARETKPDVYGPALRRLGIASCMCLESTGVGKGGAVGFLHSLGEFALALEEYGAATDAPIYPEPWKELAALARERLSVFMPSGAGGGDFGIFVGLLPPTHTWLDRAAALGFTPMRLVEDTRGVRVLS